jgi:antitoxin component YwqK of YwqJK toxin-antitoxin module
MQGKKQGKWVIHLDEVRGEPGYEEEGVFKNGNREGRWRRYSLMGDLIAIENYRWGFKDGAQQYFSMGGLEHEETWRAIDPQKKYDTIDVPDLYDQYKIEKKVVKVEGYSQKHGTWRYYMPGTQALIKTETYLFDSLYQPKTAASPVSDSTATDSSVKKAGKILPKEVQDFNKRKSKKKTIKYQDGSTGY